jgi:acetyl-CoA C-acetyltransferase
MQLARSPELGLCLNLGGGAVTSAVSILAPVEA